MQNFFLLWPKGRFEHDVISVKFYFIVILLNSNWLTVNKLISCKTTSFLWYVIQEIIRPIENPIKKTAHIQILYGNLAPQGSVAKITGKEGLYFSGELSCAVFFEFKKKKLCSNHNCPYHNLLITGIIQQVLHLFLKGRRQWLLPFQRILQVLRYCSV